MAVNPATSRIKQLTKEWKAHGLSGGYERDAGYVHYNVEKLEEAIADAQAAIHQAKETLDAKPGSGYAASKVRSDVISPAWANLQKIIETAEIAEQTSRHSLDKLPQHKPFTRAHELMQGHRRLLEEATTLKRAMSPALRVGDYEQIRAAVEAAVPKCHVSLPPGTSRG